MPISKPADGATNWGDAVRAAIGSINAQNTVRSFEPPTGLTALVAGGSTSQTTVLQAHLDHVKATYGGGVVDVRRPGSSIKLNTGITIPAGVQLLSDEFTNLDFSGLTTGAAITVNDQDFTPLIGVRIYGPADRVLSNVTVGLSVTGIGLRFYNTRIRYFGKGVDLSHANTYILSFIGGDIGHCGTCVFDDTETGALAQNGERIVFNHFTLYNSERAVHVTGNGVTVHFTNCSIDYCTEFGRIQNSWVFYTGSHLEKSGTVTDYGFVLLGNPHLFVDNSLFVLSGMAHLVNPSSTGPSNYAYGAARFSNVSAFYVDVDAVSNTQYSEHMVGFPVNATTVTVSTPFPLKWVTVTAQFAATDGYTQVNTDTVRISAIDPPTGKITLTAPAYAGGHRWVLVSFG